MGFMGYFNCYKPTKQQHTLQLVCGNKIPFVDLSRKFSLRLFLCAGDDSKIFRMYEHSAEDVSTVKT